MLEGLEAVEFSFNDLRNENWTFRIDSEFLKKEYLKNILKIQNSKSGFIKLNEAISHMTGGATPLGAEYSEVGIPFLRVQNIMQNYFSLNEVVYLTNSQNEEIKRSSLKSRDVLLTITGVSYGKSATVSKKIEGSNINQHSVKITLNNKLNPYFLSTFLNSRFGKLQSDKNIVGVTRPALDYPVIRNFNIPYIQEWFQDKIEELINRSEVLVDQSQQAFSSAEILLLQTIGLQAYCPSTDAVNVKSLSESFNTSGRLDAEFYQVRYDELLSVIKSRVPFKFIKDIRTDNFRGFQPVYEDDGELSIINSKHILETSLDYGNFEKTNIENWDLQCRARVFKGDILTYTTGANIGRTQVYLIDNKALASNHVNILRLKIENPFYVGFVMNSMIGRLQTEKYSAGSAQAELYPKDIDEFVIPLVEKDIQSRIINLVEERYHLKKQSEHLLEVAKKAVEMAIEEGEERALEYINSNS